MYKNVLVISDNLYLCKEFEKIISELKFTDINWTFSISPFSNLESFSEALKNKVSVINLKNDADVEEVCYSYDLILSIHCKQIFPDKMVKSLKCIKINQCYNPINRGWYPQVFAIVNGSYIGATIHEIDIYLDHGNIIDRDFIKIESWDTSLSLYIKINELEISLLKKNLINIVSNSYSILVPENEGKLYLKKDFDKLCQLDLNKQQTVQETINLLRALTHGEYKNAYYIDEVTGKKIYVSIELGEN